MTREQYNGIVINKRGAPVPGVTINVAVHPGAKGSPILYTAETGEGTVASLVSSERGTYSVWLEEGRYDISSPSEKNTISVISQSAVISLSHTINEPEGNVALGSTLGALTTGKENTALGVGALEAATTTKGNVAIGYLAMNALILGSSSVAVGTEALKHCVSAGDEFGEAENTAIGRSALAQTTTGFRNSAVGAYAMSRNTTGLENVAVGAGALQFSTTGNQNTALGYCSLGHAVGTPVKSNAAVGYLSSYQLVTGQNNTCIGTFAALEMTEGENNTVLGASAGSNITKGNGNILIGAAVGPAAAEESFNALYIGNGTGAEPLIGGGLPNASLKFNATQMGFFKHAVAAQGKVTGKKNTEVEKVLKTLLEALSGVGLVKDETT